MIAPGDGPPESKLQIDLAKHEKQDVVVNGKKLAVRAYLNLPYVDNPIDPEVQVLNLYVPEAYFGGGKVGKFNSVLAPVFISNAVEGYLPVSPRTPTEIDTEKDAPSNILAMALSKGYIVVSTRVRDWPSKNSTAPAPIVDLKAVVRYLRFNDPYIPGDSKKIIVHGTSRGASLAALLGASGDHPDYDAELKTLGAAPASDQIFAVASYGPITNIENADAAYEWQFNGINDYKQKWLDLRGKEKPKEVISTLTLDQAKFSNELKALFPGYVNGLKLKDSKGELLTLDEKGEGSFKEYVKSQVMDSAQEALKKKQDLSKFAWLKVEGGTVKDLDWLAYVKSVERSMPAPAFDSLDISDGWGTGENRLFAKEILKGQHFTLFGMTHSKSEGATMADAKTIRMMNPMSYIGKPDAKAAKHWRIRHGTKDNHTSLAIPVLLALALKNQNIDTDFALAWDRPQGGDYDLNELFQWMEKIGNVPPEKVK